MMMGGIIEKLFFRIHFSTLSEVNTIRSTYSLESQSTFENLIWIEYFCHFNEMKILPFWDYYMCTFVYLVGIKVQTQNKYVPIVHIWSMLQSSRVGYGKNSNASWPYYVFKQKRRKSVFWSYHHLTNMNFYLKRGWIVFGRKK